MIRRWPTFNPDGSLVRNPDGSLVTVDESTATTVEGRWSVDLCRDWVRIGSVDAFELRAVTRHLEAGEWHLSCPRSVPLFSQWVDDEDRVQSFMPRDVNTVRVVDPTGKIGFAGFVGPVSTGVGGVSLESSGGSDVLTFSGPDLWHVLSGRLAFPDPAQASGWAVAHDVRTGRASSQLAAFIQANAGFAALSERQVVGLQVDDRVAGTSGTWQARLEPLDELAARIGADADLSVRLSVDWAGQVTVLLTRPLDLSRVFVFSDKQDLSGKKVRRVPAETTYTVAGGSGAGTSRLFAHQSSGASGVARREEFHDVSALSTAGEVSAAARVNTVQGAASWSVSAEVTESVGALVYFWSLVNVGDWITIEFDDERVRTRITGAQFEITPERQVVRPVLGEASSDALVGLKRDVAGLAARFGQAVA